MARFSLIATSSLVLLLLVSFAYSQEDTDFEQQKDAEVYIVSASADGYERASVPVDATKGDSVEIQLSKSGTATASPSPILVPKDPTTPGQTAPTGSSSDGGGSYQSNPALDSVPAETDGAVPEIQVDRKMILISAIEDQSTPVSEKIVISNLGAVKAELNMQIVGIGSLSATPSKLIVAPNGQEIVIINGEIYGLKVGTYPAKMFIKSDDGRISKEVAITTVVNPAKRLFDLLLDLVTSEKKSVSAGDDIPIRLKIINIAGTNFEIGLKYGIRDTSKTFFSNQEDVVSENPTTTLEKTVKTTPDMQSGTYIIEAQLIRNGEINAVAAVNVYINGKKAIPGANPLLTILMITIIVCGAVASALYLKRDEIKKLLNKKPKKK